MALLLALQSIYFLLVIFDMLLLLQFSRSRWICYFNATWFPANVSFICCQEIDVGLAADIGTLARIPKITGNQSAMRELAFTARNFGPEEAEKFGFVSKVVKGGREEVITAALETAALISSKSPIAVIGTKHLLLHARDHRWFFFLSASRWVFIFVQC